MEMRDLIIQGAHEWAKQGVIRRQNWSNRLSGMVDSLYPNMTPLRKENIIYRLDIGKVWIKYLVGTVGSMTIGGFINLKTGKIHGSHGPKPTKDSRGDVLDAATWDQSFHVQGVVRYAKG
jgi:hypothetical protein